MIYLFCNNPYGQFFIKAASFYSKKEKVPITIVISFKKPNKGNPFIQFAFYAFQYSKICYLMIKSFCIYRTPFLVTSNVNSHSFVQKILPADCGIIAGFNQIFGKEILARFQNTANFHPSLLPYYRGPVPSYWCIKNGETRTGYTLHKATERIDDGEILFQEVVPIDRRDNPETLDQKIAQKASLTLIYYLDYICKGKEMQKIKLNAAEIYKNHAGYLSFPG